VAGWLEEFRLFEEIYLNFVGRVLKSLHFAMSVAVIARHVLSGKTSAVGVCSSFTHCAIF
jgi:hypothetical protein